MAGFRPAVAERLMGSTVAVTVRGIAAGGAGVADLPDGRVVFVPRTAPGDRVSIRLERSKPRWAVGSVSRVIEPAEERRAPLCSLYERCGGCQLQHLPYASQLEWKGRFVSDALTRIGGLDGVRPPHVEPSPEEVRYRNRMTFALRRLRGGRVVAGLHALGHPAHVVDVDDECVLPGPALREAWKALRGGWGPGARLLPAGGRLRLTLREGPSGLSLVVEGGTRGWSGEALAHAVPVLRAVWHRPGEGGAAETRLVAGRADEGGATAFAQVNPAAAALLVGHVLSLAAEGRRAVDAYCGVGAYGRELAARGWEVIGIERDADACAAARRDAPPGLSVLEGAVEDRLADALPADLLIVNPPRSGLASDVVDRVGAAGPARVIYVSCDPGTLARDVGLLSRAYAVESVTCFDLFPQTAHVETVLTLASRDGR